VITVPDRALNTRVPDGIDSKAATVNSRSPKSQVRLSTGLEAILSDGVGVGEAVDEEGVGEVGVGAERVGETGFMSALPADRTSDFATEVAVGANLVVTDGEAEGATDGATDGAIDDLAAGFEIGFEIDFAAGLATTFSSGFAMAWSIALTGGFDIALGLDFEPDPPDGDVGDAAGDAAGDDTADVTAGVAAGDKAGKAIWVAAAAGADVAACASTNRWSTSRTTRSMSAWASIMRRLRGGWPAVRLSAVRLSAVRLSAVHRRCR
jgi:hypothetical protein